jgi:ActR/RegA family two-component response regulator
VQRGKVLLMLGGMEHWVAKLRSVSIASSACPQDRRLRVPPNSRILIVEDDALLAMSLEQKVDDLGHAVVGPMHNLHDGLDCAKTGDLEFALLDFDLGQGIDAVPIAEELTRRGIPFAFTTWTDARIVRRSIATATVLAKPITVQDLVRVLG